MRVGVVMAPTGDCLLNRRDPHSGEQSRKTRDAVIAGLKELRHSVGIIEAGPDMLSEIREFSPDAVFNIAAGYRTKRDQASIAAVLELSGVPFTGSSAEAHMIGLQKHLAKMVMQAAGIRTPGFNAAFGPRDLDERLVEGLSFPVIVKPGAEGSSVGISRESVVTDLRQALSAASRLLCAYGPPVLAEEFIAGREFTVGLLGYPRLLALPVEEIVFTEDGVYTYSVKAKDNVRIECPADIPDRLSSSLQDMAVKTAYAVGCRDIARVDFRVSGDGVAYVLEINTLPGLMPGYSELPRIAEKAGIGYTEIVKILLDGALARAAERGVERCGRATASE